MWCLVGCNSVYDIGYAQTLTIHGSNSYQDIRQNHLNLKVGQTGLNPVVNETKLGSRTAHMSAINGYLLQFYFNFFIILTLTLDTVIWVCIIAA